MKKPTKCLNTNNYANRPFKPVPQLVDLRGHKCVVSSILIGALQYW